AGCLVLGGSGGDVPSVPTRRSSDLRRAPLGIRRWRSGRRGGPGDRGPAAGPQRAAASASPALGSSSASAARRSSTALRALPSTRSEEHTSQLQSRFELVCRLLLEKK